MASGSNIDMLPTLGNALPGSGGYIEDALQNELELILQAKRSRQVIGGQREMNRYRSGSAPPTVDGSLNAIGGLFGTSAFGDVNGMSNFGSSNNGMLSEEEIRSHPAYLAYYYSHESINPRLPPPLLSKEDWRVAQRFQASGSLLCGIEDWRREKVAAEAESSSLFSMQPSFPVEQAEVDLTTLRDASGRNIPERVSTEWLGSSDGMIGLSGPALGSRRRSFAGILQDGSDRSSSLSGQLSRSPSCNTFSNTLDNPAGFFNEIESGKSLQSDHLGIQSRGTGRPHSFSSSIGSSLSRSKTPEQQLLGRFAGSGLPPVGSKTGPAEKKNILGSSIQKGRSSSMNELAEIAAALSGLKLDKTGSIDENCYVSRHELNADNQPIFSLSNGTQGLQQQQLIDHSNAERFTSSAEYLDFVAKNGILPNLTASNIRSNGQVRIPKRTSSSANLYSKVHSSALADSESNAFYLNEKFPSRNTAYPDQILDSVGKSQLYAGSSLASNGDLESLSSLSKKGPDMHSSLMDARYIQYLQRVSESGLQEKPSRDAIFGRDHSGTSFKDVDQLQKEYIAALAAQQKEQFELPYLAKPGGLNQGIYGNTAYGLGMPYVGNQMPNSIFPSSSFGHVQNERISCFNSMMRSSIGTCYPDANHLNGRFISSLLDEFKTNKTRSSELSDIIDHVVEFSMDQYGSRFIQQKLETAMEEEKIKIFPEIIPHARTLMTDVFGNYVIQKFFEHGTESQRAELASQLNGHVLPLSLQMYGCRVIQKALEVVDLDQQTRMVKELDGSVMKCVRDQNGNHVIQKCIECVPQDRIQFIISAFYGQVVALSTHPYGCRVIQRVLEHCNDQETQQIVMDEVMQCVCSLAQDQYGNYVIQHVLEHGKPSERSAIIGKLAGQIVKMSQQKFASNVVEKCLTFGGPEERKLLVDEMLGLTDENEPLQAMMKDPFGNYVVQKVLETCDDQSLQLILSRIRIHLNTLKKYTYGKHIVSRVEKLIAAGERRIMLSSYAS